jgi:cytosine/uracil/thiamine/allantoin permease
VFWRDRDVTYHLYARSPGVSLADLQAVARGMLAAAPPKATTAAAGEARGARPWWGAALFVGALVALAIFVATRRTSQGRT